MRVKYFYCDENMLLLVNLYVRILDITLATARHVLPKERFQVCVNNKVELP